MIFKHCLKSERRGMPRQKRNPEDIGADVSSHLSWDSSLDHTNIHIDVVNDIVTLSGTVPTYRDLWQAEHDARVVPGVAMVDNRLKVASCVSPEVNDRQVRDRVRHVLEWNPAIDPSRINVTVENHVVTLTGKTETYWQKSKALSLAADVIGVDEVVDRLKVEPPAGVTDLEIIESMDETIERLNIDIGAVDVSVDKGLVTLKGTVGDYRTYCTVEDIAGCTEGVTAVSNDLRVG